uniref:Uncharacterized protein n=1 Tax=Anopheles coluzzii TaxID=1518534 RepID=A0A8W7PNT8_ANOCL
MNLTDISCALQSADNGSATGPTDRRTFARVIFTILGRKMVLHMKMLVLLSPSDFSLLPSDFFNVLLPIPFSESHEPPPIVATSPCVMKSVLAELGSADEAVAVLVPAPAAAAAAAAAAAFAFCSRFDGGSM